MDNSIFNISSEILQAEKKDQDRFTAMASWRFY